MDPTLLLNFAYVLNLIAMTVKDVLWLRALLLPAQVSFLTWGAFSGQMAPVVWNVVFVAINGVQIVRILLERRPIELPEELVDLYEKLFTGMKRREFLLFWETGTQGALEDEHIVHEGEEPKQLLCIVSGQARVSKQGRPIASLSRGQFVAELSFLSHERASADVVAVGELRYNSWNQDKLRSLEKINPELYQKLQHILSRDVTDKIKTTSDRMGELG